MKSLRARPKGGTPEPDELDGTRPKGLGRRSLDALRVGVLVLDGEDRPTLVNPAAKEMGLLRAGPLGGVPVAHSSVRTLAGQARRTGTRRELELDLPRGTGGEPLGVHLRAVPLEDDYVSVEAIDVTESHRVARVRRDFVANVSHELKTPIGALHLLAEALMEALRTDSDAGDPVAARRFAEGIHRESARMGRLVSELLELSRLQGAEPMPVPVAVPVDRVIAEVLDRTRTAAAAKGIELVTTGGRGLVAHGDEDQLVTAVANLADNAVTYTPHSESPDTAPQVRIEARGDNDFVEITVADEGMGIAQQDLDRIFERFYRADQARERDTGGTGLGLAIVKHVAANHGGQVRVSSTIGEGSAFTLRLPAQTPDQPDGGSPDYPAGPEAAGGLVAGTSLTGPVIGGAAAKDGSTLPVSLPTVGGE